MTPMNNRRVVITGCGAVTPIGIGKEEFWSALERGENGVDYITLFDTEKHTTKIAAEVKNFNPENWLDKKEVRRTDRVLHFAAAGADLAVQDAGLDLEKLDKEMFGVYVGSGEGGIHTIEENFRLLYEKGPSRVSPFMVPMMITNMPAGYIAIRLGAKGPNMAVVTACASSTHSMGEAYNCIMRGDADVMITGGVEAAISPLATAGFSSLKALSGRNDDPKHASRPFDADRDGFVIGEGAGILVFEEYEHAKARGAHIYAEVKGYGLSCDAHHITAPAPDGDGAYRVEARGDRPHQRARNLDAAQREDGDRRDKAPHGRRRGQGHGSGDEVDGRTCARSRRRGRHDSRPARLRARNSASDDKLPDAGPRVRNQRSAQQGREREGRESPRQQLRLRRTQRSHRNRELQVTHQ